MAKPSSRRLKVFQSQFGFYDTVVAAPSQAAALRAWGTHQNLFASGQATIVEEDDDIKAALAHPETPLRRPIGSNNPFAIDPTGTPVIPSEPKTGRRKAPVKSKEKAAPALKPPADRSTLDAAESALRHVEDARKTEEARFRRREEELEADKQIAQQAYVERRQKAADAISKAERAYRAAGGDG